jgi:hypothetical protein
MIFYVPHQYGAFLTSDICDDFYIQAYCEAVV